MSTDSDRRLFSSREFVVLALILLALRIAYAAVLKFDLDEPQHLHVVWAWTVGKLPYRDVFDNHAPLFQFLCAPLFHLIPERPDIVVPMRWAMLPLYALAVFAVYRLGSAFYSRKLALLIAVIGSLLPPFFLKSIEFRPDELWAAVWFLCLATLMQGPPTVRRSLLFGLLLGVSFSISLKTTLFVLALAFSLAVALVLKACDKSERIDGRHLLKCVCAPLPTLLIFPALVVVYFWFRGILPELRYGLITHNVVSQLKHAENPGYRHPWFPLALISLLICATLIYRRCQDRERRARTVFTFLAPWAYALMLFGFWPDIPHEDDLPLYPLIPLSCCLLAGALLPVARRAWLQPYAARLAWAVVVLQIAWLIVTQRPWDRENHAQLSTLAIILQLTNPGEYVMDPVAGAVYRPRPFFYALETVTKTRLRHNLTPDTIRADMISTGTKVAMLQGVLRFSRAHDFILGNYVALKQRNDIRVIGRFLITRDPAPDNVYHFDVVIPAKYSLVDRQGRVVGTLDGSPFDGARELAVGPHEFHPTGTPVELALFWDRAWEKGYQPDFADPETFPKKGKPGS